MRVDGVTIQIPNPAGQLKNHPELEYTVKVNESTGELISQTAKYRGLFITVFARGNARINGSLHKYFNGGEHNYNELSHSDLANTLFDLETRFGVDLNTARITRIEFGVNIHPHLPTEDLLLALIMHKTTPFYTVRGSGIDFMVATYGEYKIKAYDKGLQHNTQDDIFRFEVFAVKSWLSKTGINTLSDLLDQAKYQNLGKILNDEFGKLFIIDPPNFRKMKGRDALNCKDFLNPKYWEKLSGDYKHRRLNEARKFLDKYCLNTIHKTTAELIAGQIAEYQSDGPKHPRFLTMVSESDSRKETSPLFNHLDNSDKNRTQTLSERRCVVTGADISAQHPDSRHLSPAGLRHLEEHDPATYQDVLGRFGPRDESLDHETRNYRTAHNIRNFLSNQWRDMRNMETKYQGNYSMFVDHWLLGSRATLALIVNQ